MKKTRKYPALGILFREAMVQAIQAGRKTQTRRILKPQPEPDDTRPLYIRYRWPSLAASGMEYNNVTPAYQVGDILYVKETWYGGYMVKEAGGLQEELTYWYRADAPSDARPGDVSEDWCINEFGSENKECWPRWKSSLFMPYEAARLFLKVTDVRVERLNDISKADAIAEGISGMDNGFVSGYKDYTWPGPGGNDHYLNAYNSYATLWESINGKDSWKENPYVWVYTFERTEKPAQP